LDQQFLCRFFEIITFEILAKNPIKQLRVHKFYQQIQHIEEN